MRMLNIAQALGLNRAVTRGAARCASSRLISKPNFASWGPHGSMLGSLAVLW